MFEAGSWLHRIVDDPGLALRKILVYGTILAIYAFVIAVSAFTCFGLPVAILSLLLFLVQYYYSDRLMLLATGARILSREEAPDCYAMVDDLSARLGIKAPRMAIIVNDIPNSFATGRNQDNAVVAYTTGLMNRLTNDEIRAVTAHELSHIKNKDMFVVVFTSFAVGLLAWAAYTLFHLILARGRRSFLADVLSGMVSWFLSATFGVLLVNTVSRYREYGADRGSALVTGNPDALIRALTKITAAPCDSRSARAMDPVRAVLTGSTSRAVSELFSTHPLVEKRIAALEQLKAELQASATEGPTSAESL